MKSEKLALFIGIIILVFCISFFNFSKSEIYLDIDGTAGICNSSWWGFKKEYIELKSKNNIWCYKTKDGKWDELRFYDYFME